MVDLSGGPDGPLEHGFSNTVFIVPGAIIFGLSAFFGWMLYQSIKYKEKKKEEKKKLKQRKKK